VSLNADAEYIDQAAFTQASKHVSHLIGWLMKLRGDLLVGERAVLLQQFEDYSLHLLLERSSASAGFLGVSWLLAQGF
jgi:hypothetical protein